MVAGIGTSNKPLNRMLHPSRRQRRRSHGRDWTSAQSFVSHTMISWRIRCRKRQIQRRGTTPATELLYRPEAHRHPDTDGDGPSRTHVVSAGDTKQTGWTNAYLPSTPPTTVATAPGGRR